MTSTVEPKRQGLGVVLAIVALDFAGIGLTLPIIPRLLSEVAHTPDLSWRFGAFLSLYALMQFIFSPILGAWSDRIGRRPVLLFSLAGATVDYILMALAPSLALLFVGRAIAGITGASLAVASAYIADVSSEDQRARRFGQLNAFQGLGFIAGPVIGGLLGDIWLRAPFIAAAALNGVTFLVTLLILREPQRHVHPASEGSYLNPLKPFHWAFSISPLLPLLLIYVIFALIGQVGGTIWVVYGSDRFAWSPLWIGISIACFGFLHAIAQAFIAGPMAERWGERFALLTGVITDGTASVAIAFATQGWMAFALMPLFCLGGVGMPALQSLMTGKVDPADQGRLQGVLASLNSLVSIGGPLAISTVYFAYRTTFPGLVWIAGAALYVVSLPAFFRVRAKSTRMPEH
ncbi:MAG: Tet(A)/Tet(B)/Tet(C) family tetracycline efflux MFS transporter [Steroidobacteraceae bacterium]